MCSWGHSYKTGWIHGFFEGNREVISAQFADYSVRYVKSYHAAKLAITRWEKEQGAKK